jgi:LacI family transcriptional regulator
MPTIRDVAVHARVSPSTVSHVLNRTRYVDPQTEERVRGAIEALGYRPNSVARSLRRRTTSTIGLLVPDISNPFFADIARAIEDAGFSAGYNVVLCNSDGSETKELAYIDVLLSKQVDGLILISSGSRPDPLQVILDAGVPVVVADRELGGLPVDQVLVDNEQGGYLAGRYLAQLGHRRIGCIAGSDGLALSMGRITGFRRALAEAEIELQTSAIVHADFHYSSGEAAMRELLQRKLNLTAVFAANDMMAIGAVNVLSRSGLCVPDAVSVIGFDNILQSNAIVPSITTIAQPVAELGQMSISLLLRRMKRPGDAPSRELLPTRLVERESCRALVESRQTT